MTTQRNLPGAARWEALAANWARHGTLVPRRSARDAVALGVQLLMLKDAAAHGTWRNSVNAMGMEAVSASHFMALARRFADAPDTFFNAIGSAGKMTELLPLSDTDTGTLAHGGEVHGLTLERMTPMTVRELRNAVRTARQAEAQQHGEEGLARLTKDLKPTYPKPVRLTLEEERLLRLFRQCCQPAREVILGVTDRVVARQCSIRPIHQKG